MTSFDIIPLVISVNMSDYLRVTLTKNRNYFNNYYVLTCPEDENTKKLCAEFNAEYIEYNHFFTNAKFNKSGGIKTAQDILHKKYPENWILLIDVDIILSPELIDTINKTNLDKNNLYGAKRYDLWNEEEFIKQEKKRLYRHKFAGYFQLYFRKNIYYPDYSNNASCCDITFSNNFRNRFKIEFETHVFHIGKEQSHWDGKGMSWIS
jgi:hypothetical protein